MRHVLIPAILAITLAGTLAGPVRPGPVADLLFAEGIFATLPEGQEMIYAHQRHGTAAPGFVAVTDGRMTLVTGHVPAAGTESSLSLTIEASGMPRRVVDFPASGGNPVLMVLLESTVNNMAAVTGGSPFYIRNRIKDALRSGGETRPVSQEFAGRTVAAQEVTLRPFAQDKNRARMGEFADLTLRFGISDAVPGRFLLLSADTAVASTGYHETITLMPQEIDE